uniref:Small integral membrane protein 20 n=1 Tax=Panagrellus redivivus TaxID=6233 RepID=A0A7E4UTF6_PANRE
MRVPEGAPVSGWLKFQQKFPALRQISKPSLGTVAVIACITTTVFAVYAVGVGPKIHNDYYKESQKEKRALLRTTREETAQGLRPWSDPFERK